MNITKKKSSRNDNFTEYIKIFLEENCYEVNNLKFKYGFFCGFVFETNLNFPEYEIKIKKVNKNLVVSLIEKTKLEGHEDSKDKLLEDIKKYAEDYNDLSNYSSKNVKKKNKFGLTGGVFEDPNTNSWEDVIDLFGDLPDEFIIDVVQWRAYLEKKAKIKEENKLAKNFK